MHTKECFKILCSAIGGTTAVFPKAVATSEIHGYAASNNLTISSERGQLVRRQDDCLGGSEIFHLERSLCQDQKTILMTFSDNI